MELAALVVMEVQEHHHQLQAYPLLMQVAGVAVLRLLGLLDLEEVGAVVPDQIQTLVEQQQVLLIPEEPAVVVEVVVLTVETVLQEAQALSF
jgi:hypothetical protein